MKKVIRGFMFLLPLIFGIAIPLNIVQANTTRQPMTYIDTPWANTSITSNTPVSGWAVNSSGIREVNIFVDDISLGRANTGIDRPDVNKAFPGYRDGDKSGYSFNLEIDKVPAGARVLRVQAVGNDGSRHEARININIAKPQPRLWIDRPGSSVVLRDKVMISGWALNASGIREVQVYLNNLNNLVGKAKIGENRPDVNKVFPGYKDGDKSGFSYEMSLDGSAVSYGTHTIIIRAVGNDGDVRTSTFNVVKPQPMMHIDTPANNITVRNNITISGWALNYNGIKEVNIYSNGVFLGKASTGIMRPDVDKVFPGYLNGDRSGYQYLLEIDKLASGINNIRIEAVGNDGSVREGTLRLNVIKPPPMLHLDTPGSTLTLRENIQISGWALNASGIKEVAVYLNNYSNLIGRADTGIGRPDVDKVFPGYKNGAESGFKYDLRLDMNALNAGSHTVIVRAVGNDGEFREARFTVVKPAPMMLVDTPFNNSVIRNSFNISGWALSFTGIKEVNIFLNGNAIGKANTGIDRPDVDRVYPGYTNGSKSGFNYHMDINTLGRGKHTIRVQAVGNDNSIRESSFTIDVQKPAPMMNIETPANNSLLRDGMSVAGWSLNASGIREIQVYLNNTNNLIGKAHIGQLRPDVNKVYPGYRDGDKSGFSFPLDLKVIPSGTHRIILRSVGNDGDISEASFMISKASPQMMLEAPVKDQNFKGNIRVSGWALNASGINTVSVYSSNRLLGQATVGISRPDVNASLNQNGRYKDGDKSGFAFEININDMKPGTHLIIVKAVGHDGEERTSSVAITTGNVLINYTHYNITLNEIVTRQMGNSPAMHVYNNSARRWEWRYARIMNGQPGYFIYDNNNRQVWTHSPQQYEDIRLDLIDQINPLNSMYDNRRIYQFLRLSYVEGTTAAELNAVFSPIGVLAGKGQVFLDAAKKSNINPIYLAAHAILETGNGTSRLARGIEVNGVTVHNLFGIRAFDHDPDGAGSQYAFECGWTDIDKAIHGGAEWISSRYINHPTHKQDTLYKMRWNPANPTVHQYATDVRWAFKQTKVLMDYFEMFPNAKLVFDIPVFR